MSDTRLAVLLTIVAIVTAIAAILIMVMMWHDDAHQQEEIILDRRATRSPEDAKVGISCLSFETLTLKHALWFAGAISNMQFSRHGR